MPAIATLPILFLLSGRVLPGFGPVGFRPRLRSISSDGIYGNLGTQIVSLLLEIDFTLRPIFPSTSLLTTLFTTYYITYYIYISKFIETILREKKIQLDREVPQTIGVTWPKPDGVETRKDPRKNKNTERT